MSDRLEHDLTTLFDDRATAIHAPPVPLDRLVRDGEVAVAAHRRRTRMVAVAAVAAAVLLAATIPLVLRGQNETTPQPAEVPRVTNTSTERPASDEDLPTGPPPAVPYVLDDVLHLDGEQYELPLGHLELEATTGSRVLFTESAGGRVRLWVLRDAGLVPLNDVRSNPLVPRLSPDGAVVAALIRESRDLARISVFDVATGEEIGRVDPGAPINRVDLGGMDDRGRVYWQQRTDGGLRAFVWTPGGRPRQLDLPGSIADVGPGGIVVETYEEVGTRVREEFHYGTVSARGGFETVRRVPAAAEWGVLTRAPWSDDGRLLASANLDVAPGSAPRVTITDVTSGEQTKLLLPADGRIARVVTFEGRRNVIVASGEQTVRFLRCSVRSGACDRLPLPVGPDDEGPRFASR